MDVLTVDYRSPNAPELFCKSLKETGFAVLTHHPISTILISDAYKKWQDFFVSSQKDKFTFEKGRQDGYFPYRTENAKDSSVSDLKEFFHYYAWGKVPDDVKKVSDDIYNEIVSLAKELLQWVEDYLPVTISGKLSMPLHEMVENSQNTLLRILHYPPLTGEVEEGAVRAGAHEDINLITLLPAATAPGLEVQDTEGNWHEVTCNPGNIAVNVGDMLQMCTDHYYISTTHRVVNPEGEAKKSSRYSMPLFLHPRPDVKLSPDYTAQEYLHQRLREIGIM